MKKIKICGLSRPIDIVTVNQIMPDYCGFIINFPKSRRNLSTEAVKSLRANLSSAIIPVGVFVDQPPQVVADLLNDGTISIAQLHGQEDDNYIAALRKLTNKPIWKAFQINNSCQAAHAAKSTADFVLLDAGQGIGRAFDWTLLSGFPRIFGLAGGLSTENLPEALKTEASLLDVSSGVETAGVKDPEKIKNFIKIARSL